LLPLTGHLRQPKRSAVEEVGGDGGGGGVDVSPADVRLRSSSPPVLSLFYSLSSAWGQCVERVCLCVSVAIRIKLFSPYLFPVFPNAFITFTLPKPVPLQVASQRSTKMPTSIVFVLYAGIGIAVRVNEGGGVGEGRESGMRFTGLGLGWLIFRLC
jgi:hypothetical protein